MLALRSALRALVPPLLVAGALAFTAAARAQECDDAALSEAAAALLAEAERPDAAALREAAARAGSDVPWLLALPFRDGDDDARASALHTARERAGAHMACGESRSEGYGLVLAGPRDGSIEVISRDRVRVHVEDGWRSPRLEIRDRAGRTAREPVRPGVDHGLPSDLEPPLVIQLVADGPEGPRPLAERWTGEASPAEPIDPRDLSIEARLDALRAETTAAALRANRLLSRVAAHHAEAVCHEGRVRHVGEDGDPEERLARAGVRARHVGEAVARAEDATRAYAALLRSPSHRSALGDPRFTDAGVGLATDARGHACLVVLLAAWPRPQPY